MRFGHPANGGRGCSHAHPFTEDPQGRSAPLVEAVPSAPPALELPNPTIEFTCGNCGAVLCVGPKKKFILSWSFATPAARTIQPTSDPFKPRLRGNWIGAGLASALRPNAFTFRRALAGCNFWPRFNASASSRHAFASLASKHAAWDRRPLQQCGGILPLVVRRFQPELACGPLDPTALQYLNYLASVMVQKNL